MIDIDIKDEFGGIDECIKKAVYDLNAAGFNTTGSCEGHADHGAPVPWIHVATAGESEYLPDSEDAPKWKKENEKLRAKIEAAIDEFYSGRNVSEDNRVATRAGNWGFWVYCGKDAFAEWREEIDTLVEKKEKGEPYVKPEISEADKKDRAGKLSVYQKEMELFTEFLKNRGI